MMRGMSSPGSTTMASWEVSSPRMEQLHWRGPTGDDFVDHLFILEAAGICLSNLCRLAGKGTVLFAACYGNFPYGGETAKQIPFGNDRQKNESGSTPTSALL